jgi:Peptidase family M48
MTVLLASTIAVAIVLPHLLNLDRAEPATAAGIWLVALALRALAAVYLVLTLVLFIPASASFDELTHWCWHAALPFMAAHLGVSGHQFGHLATVIPAGALAASAALVAWGLARSIRRTRALLHTAAIGPGPGDSVLVGGAQVLVAAAGLRRPRVVLSTGALVTLDDEELAASIDHERGHISRGHRFLFLFAELCRGLARLLPGTNHALREVSFHLERDADVWAVRRRHDPAALASAICKAASPMPSCTPSLAALAGGGVTGRVSQLLDLDGSPSAYARRLRLRALLAALVTIAVLVTAMLPATAAAGSKLAHAATTGHNCQS